MLTFNKTNIVCAKNDNTFSCGRGFVGGRLQQFTGRLFRSLRLVPYRSQTGFFRVDQKKIIGNIAR